MEYKLIERKAAGGFGVVDVVEDENGVLLARKTFHPERLPEGLVENARQRFIHEVKIQKEISHRNVVPILDYDVDRDFPYYIMPLAECTLHDESIKTPNKADPKYFLKPVLDILSGLEELHSIALYHRDLKPQNVLKFLTEEGETFYAISDFGLIAIRQSNITNLTQPGMAKGSDSYTAPEILEELKHASAMSDIFSVGCILHDFVGKRMRFPGTQIKEGGPWGNVLEICTRSDRVRRFKTVESLREAILEVEYTTEEEGVVLGQKYEDLFLILDRMPDDLESQDVEMIVKFAEESTEDDNYDGVMMGIKLQFIRELEKSFPDMLNRLAPVYAKWVRNKSFDFEACDGISNRLEAFIKTVDIGEKAECIMAMLYLGTGHNRWYVEKKVFRLCSVSMDNNLARRVALEIMTDEAEACRAFNHLTWSIGVSLKELHPVVWGKISQQCR